MDHTHLFSAARPRRWSRFALVLALLVPLLTATAAISPLQAASFQLAEAFYPDLQTVVPRQLQLVNKQQREWLRFSNGIANTGGGPWQMRPAFPLDPSGSATQDAYQEIVDPSGAILDRQLVSQFEFHPAHNHWHIDAVALFEVRLDSPVGPVFGDNSIKTTFCLIDWYTLEGNARTPDRTFWDCNAKAETQGISVGWVDQYNQSVEGQALDITDAPTDRLLYLVSTANPDGAFLEQNYTNNTAWVSFRVLRESNGNSKIELVDRSPCQGSLCGDKAPNR